MKLKLKIEKEFEVVTLMVSAGVRYWEDAQVNGIEDVHGDLIPCRKQDMWEPFIDIETGKIKNWEIGKIASIHYKVCDQFSCALLTKYGEAIADIEDEYVPSFMCPKESGYGDYIIMDIDANGVIKNWNNEPDLSCFEND